MDKLTEIYTYSKSEIQKDLTNIKNFLIQYKNYIFWLIIAILSLNIYGVLGIGCLWMTSNQHKFNLKGGNGGKTPKPKNKPKPTSPTPSSTLTLEGFNTKDSSTDDNTQQPQSPQGPQDKSRTPPSTQNDEKKNQSKPTMLEKVSTFKKEVSTSVKKAIKAGHPAPSPMSRFGYIIFGGITGAFSIIGGLFVIAGLISLPFLIFLILLYYIIKKTMSYLAEF